VGVSAALYLSAGLKLLTLGALFAVKDVRTLGPTPPETDSQRRESLDEPLLR
jgi:hypothetical protein